MDEQALSELLECSVCLERLDHTSKVLPCQHTFCRRCLEEILSTQQELRCPECRTLVTVRVEDLPPNILLVRLLEGLKTQSYVLSSKPSSYQRKRDTSADSRPPHPARTGWDGPQPCARALYSYDASEKDDLSFKKGSTVTLRRQIDDNWYEGELNGLVGVFPASYVQVLVPLPQIPQCRALYDFQLDDEMEKDCLTFKKDQVINVIRKVDTNWIEGRKGDKIGILPLAFVELNHAAKMLISSKPPSLVFHRSSRSNTATTDSASLTTATTTATPTPSTSSQRSSSPARQSQTARSSPQKRHSFTPKSDSPSPPPQVQRHSLEVGSSNGGGASTTVTTATTTSSASSLSPSSVSPLMTTSMPAVLTCPGRPPTSRSVSATANGASGEAISSKESNSSSASSASGATITPHPSSVYVAMYNYRPQKEDELELRKGDYYTVSEKCQDGWFKGQCLRTGVAGVFPGNYVQVIRQAASFKPQNPNILNIRAKVPSPHNHHSHHHTHHHHAPTRSLSDVGSSSPPIPPHIKTSSSAAPPLLPRVARMSSSSISSSASAAGHSSPQSSHGHGSKSISNTHVPVTITSGRSSRSAESSSSSTQDPNHVHIGVGATGQVSKHTSSSSLSSSSSSKLTPGSSDLHRRTSSPHSGLMSVHHSMSTSSNITPPNVVMGPSESSSAPLAVVAKDKDKREKREKERKGLVKLWPGKSKKSKSTAADGTPAHLTADLVAHTRSGSFPSERNSPGTPRESSQHRKTASLDSTSTSPLPKVRSKSQLRERYRCIVPYPPQTEHELELESGDIVHVHKRREDGWYKGTQERTSKTGLFPGSFVEKCD
ncbi:E3 ubiquitin-protein ligase SH3RF3-like [Littorina saxatilis]|uniref:RING-type E3 ubiquitin transferase n=1 Tax=Littorina saxatilis TaxID=31220 RepID=A0AAN9G6W1_9CAEN